MVSQSNSNAQPKDVQSVFRSAKRGVVDSGLDNDNQSMLREGLEALKPKPAAVESQNFIRKNANQDKTVCFGDKVIMYFNQSESDDFRKPALAISAEGLITDSIDFFRIDCGLVKQSIDNCLFEITDLSGLTANAERDATSLKWEDDKPVEEGEQAQEGSVGHESRVLFGQSFLLRHTASGKYLSVGPATKADGPGAFVFNLQQQDLDSAVFKFVPFSRRTDMGTAILYSDEVLLRSEGNLNRYQVKQTKSVLAVWHLLVVSEVEETAWCLFPFDVQQGRDDLQPKNSLRDGDVIQVVNPERGFWLSVQSSSQHEEPPLTLSYQSKVKGQPARVLSVKNIDVAFCKKYDVVFDNSSSHKAHSLWEVKRRDFGRSDPFSHGEGFLLKHVVTGGLLAFNFVTNRFYLEESVDRQPLVMTFISDNDPTNSMMVQVDSIVSIRVEGMVVVFKRLNGSGGELERDNQRVRSGSLANLTRGEGDAVVPELAEATQFNHVCFQIKQHPSLAKMALFLSTAVHFCDFTFNRLLLWDMNDKENLLEYNSNTSASTRQEFIAGLAEFRRALALLSGIYINYRLQSKAFQSQFAIEDDRLCPFESVVEELGLLPTVIRVLDLAVSKTYTLSLKLLDMHSEKDSESVDFMTYKRLFHALEKSGETAHFEAMNEIPFYESAIKSALQFCTLLSKDNPRFADVVLANSSFLTKVFHFFESDTLALLRCLLASSQNRDQANTTGHLFLKLLFSGEDPSGLMILLMNHPSFLAHLVRQIDLNRSAESLAYLKSHVFLAKPCVHFSTAPSATDSPGSPDDSLTLIQGGNQVDGMAQLHLTVPESKINRQVQPPQKALRRVLAGPQKGMCQQEPADVQPVLDWQRLSLDWAARQGSAQPGDGPAPNSEDPRRDRGVSASPGVRLLSASRVHRVLRPPAVGSGQNVGAQVHQPGILRGVRLATSHVSDCL